MRVSSTSPKPNMKGILGQAIPAANLLTNLYTCPAGVTSSVPGVIACNQGSATTYRIALAMHGASDDPSQYAYFDKPLGQGDTMLAGLDLTLGPYDTIRVSSANGMVSFTCSGREE